MGYGDGARRWWSNKELLRYHRQTATTWPYYLKFSQRLRPLRVTSFLLVCSLPFLRGLAFFSFFFFFVDSLYTESAACSFLRLSLSFISCSATRQYVMFRSDPHPPYTMSSILTGFSPLEREIKDFPVRYPFSRFSGTIFHWILSDALIFIFLQFSFSLFSHSILSTNIFIQLRFIDVEEQR